MRSRTAALAALLFLAAPEAVARAQCAAKVSSCAQCHEAPDCAIVRRADEDWHKDHALGDFCAGCHGGDPAAEGDAEAHAGLVWPLADSSRSCAPCHAENHRELAQRYAARAAAPDRKPSAASPPSAASGSGNRVVGALATFVALGGSAFVAWNERRRAHPAGGAA